LSGLTPPKVRESYRHIYYVWALRFEEEAAGTMATNRGMFRIKKNSGMIEDGVRKRHFMVAGSEVDLIHYAVYQEKRTR
jgi:RimJ/RimL family protein N-acetyltransferase